MDYGELLATPNQFVERFPLILRLTQYGNYFNPSSPFMAMQCHTSKIYNIALF